MDERVFPLIHRGEDETLATVQTSARGAAPVPRYEDTSVMAMKLFAHVLRMPGVDSDGPAAAATSDSRRWVFRDLVVPRDGYAAWGLWRASVGPVTPPRDPAIEPVWSDTQPWCHK